MDLNDYIALFPGASREKQKFIALVEAVLQQAVDLMTLVAEINPAFSVNHAVCTQLDSLAASFGLARESGMTDETFRQYIRAKLALWTWDGTNAGVKPVLNTALAGSTQTDNMDGTVTANPAGTLPVDAGKLFPVPAGIRLNIEEESE